LLGLVKIKWSGIVFAPADLWYYGERNGLFLLMALMDKSKHREKKVQIEPLLGKDIASDLAPPEHVMIVVGGQAPKAIRSVECYDFEEERWDQVAELPSRRCRAGVVFMAGNVYAVGGFNGSLRVRTVDVYDGVKDQWTSIASMQERR
ncbi:PREDICTED: kelch-like protein 3, partial [Tinamus guttatus]|uniref:kelch-like protein 3 n=1 Tax=Tinamus guttatus TaxID=94827 RepID=UPI00052E7C3E